ncbi:MAG TPA: DUF2076 domain-containing protein [Devosia sp.]
MLNSDDRRAIEGLFSRVADVERQNPHRDPEAERLIADEIRRQPAAPYYLAQTVLVQEHALEVAERRIRELEQRAERRDVDRPRGPWERNDQYDDRSDRRGGWGGGGFLAGAAQTAMGVAGGVLLGSAIGSLFGGGSAHAAETHQQNDVSDSGNDAGNDQDFGDAGDFGGDGGFDMGGDF